jgi:hypothetical protein
LKKILFSFLLLLGLGTGVSDGSSLHTQEAGGLPGHHSDKVEIG